MSRHLVELNVDALPGPTHVFGGLGVGNVASMQSNQQPSFPKRAALQGLKKAALVARLGVPQFIWLPPQRPDLGLLRRIGFDGPRDQVLAAAFEQAPIAFAAAFSSAFMWAANSGTFSPGVDCADGKNHFTPANLISSWHRSGEASDRAADMQQMFASDAGSSLSGLVVHEPLPPLVPLRDEGAANHMRLSDASGRRGINLLVHGDGPDSHTSRFTLRHTQAASRAIAQLHTLDQRDTFFLQQHPEAIGAGAFHNDVIATSHRDLLIYHEKAFVFGDSDLIAIQQRFEQKCGSPLRTIKISERQLSLAAAIESYFFNSQILTPLAHDGSSSEAMVLVCPEQCRANQQARAVVEGLVNDDRCPIQSVHYVELGQSMSGGGGPACVRLRIPLEADQLSSLGRAARLTPQLHDALFAAIEATYPDSLSLRDLLDVEVIQATQRAAETLRRVLEPSP